MSENIWSQNDLNKEFESFLFALRDAGGLILDVGCGANKADPSFIGVDPYYEGDTVNVKAYMWDMPFGDGTVDGIVCFSALEHISKFKIGPTLTEFERVLKPGGMLILVVPDLLFCAIEFIKNPNVNWNMDLIFGIQSHEGEYHRTGFTEEILRMYIGDIPRLHLSRIYTVNAYMQLNLGAIIVKDPTISASLV